MALERETSWENACGSIQQAVDHCKLAGSGTIYVAAGVYPEKVIIANGADSISILGGFPAQGGDRRAGSQLSVIDGRNHDCCIAVRNSRHVNLDGLVVANAGTGTMSVEEMRNVGSGGISYDYAEGNITHCQAYNCSGYGIFVGEIREKKCRVSDCTVSHCEWGIFSQRHPVSNCVAYDNREIGISVSDATISCCEAYGNNGVGLSVTNGQMTFCRVYNNRNEKSSGGGIRAKGFVTVYGCEVFNNTALKGGGIYSWCSKI